MAHTDDERRVGLNDAVEKVRADLRIIEKDHANDADCVAPSSRPVLLDPDKPLEP